jgi:dUTP pyrophosphatase
MENKMLDEIEIKIENKELFYKLGNIPKKATDGSGAYDIFACIEDEITIYPGETKLIPTGFSINIKDPYWAAIFLPRSGLGAKKGLVLGNLIGFIDSDYQGECFVPAWNRNINTEINSLGIKIAPGDRITQMAFIPVGSPKFNLVEEFSSQTKRGQGGFGSTGV